MSHFESDQERLVQEFFADHRRRVEELSADEVTWVRIRDRHRRGSRRNRWGTAAGLLTAAAALGIGAFAVWPQLAPDEDPGLAGPATTSPAQETDASPTDQPTATDPTGDPTDSATPDPTTEPTTDAPTTGPADLPSLAADAVLTDVGGSGDTLWALAGQDQCGERPDGCTLLVRSTDAGRTWTPVNVVTDLAGVGYYRLTFADASTGWVWGGEGLFVTRDGGMTFEPVPYAGTTVNAVVSDGTRLGVVTSTDCREQQGCADVRVALGTPGDTDLVADALPLVADPQARYGAVHVSLGPDAAYVGTEDPEVTAAAETKVLNGLFRVQDGAVETMATPQDCESGVRALAASPAIAGLVYAACPSGGSDTDVAVVPSELGGRTWGSPGDGHAAPYGTLHLAVTPADTLVWVSQDEMLVSADRGRTFTEPPEPLPLTSGGLGHLAVSGGAVHAVPAGAGEPGEGARFWTSEDGGLTWRQVDLLD
jgi:hypothetical protein